MNKTRKDTAIAEYVLKVLSTRMTRPEKIFWKGDTFGFKSLAAWESVFSGYSGGTPALIQAIDTDVYCPL